MTRRDAPQDTSPPVFGQPGETDGTAQADATDETDDEYEPL